jgi:hypothetical protein
LLVVGGDFNERRTVGGSWKVVSWSGGDGVGRWRRDPRRVVGEGGRQGLDGSAKVQKKEIKLVN